MKDTVAVWEEARDAHRKAIEALSTAKDNVREAEAHRNKCWDTERSAYLAMRDDPNWDHFIGRNGNWLSSQVKDIEKKRKKGNGKYAY